MLSPDVPMVITRPHYIVGSDCGYCHDAKVDFFLLPSLPEEAKVPTKSTHITIGSQVEQMTCYHYDELINQGFRRSGNFLYKGDMLRGCCRMYTIRTNLEYMKVLKEHRQTINRFKKAIGYDEKSKNTFELLSLIVAEQNSTNFKTRFEPAKFSKEKFRLYKKYQVSVHNDDPSSITERSFDRFLCKAPFLDLEIDGTSQQWDALNSWVLEWKGRTNSTKRIGPTHECYYLDEKLIAVSVLDFLPSGVSSIYFIWDPDYAHLLLGTLLGLREIQMCHELGLGYYYLGYYIDDCPKMRYKAKFGGELLDICNEVYVPLEKVRPLLKGGRFFALEEADSDEEESEDEDSEDDAKHGEAEMEHDMEQSGHPTAFSGDLVDISEKLYCCKTTYDDAQNASSILAEEYGIAPSDLPLVLAGAIPLIQVLTWFETKVIDFDLEVSLFEPSLGRMFECTFGALSGQMRSTVIDFLRLYGLEKLQDSVVIL